MSHNGYPPEKAEATLPSLVNAEYMQSNDDEILSFTSNESYWWLHPTTVRSVRVDAHTIKTQFTDFFNTMINKVIPADSDIRRYMTADRVDVPGLAERPPNPAPSNSACSGPPHCANCENYGKLRETVQLAHSDLLMIERRVDEALRVGVEAADKSVSRIAVFNILGALGKESPAGIPFQKGQSLPPWFEKKYPEHSDDEHEISEVDAAPSSNELVSLPTTSIPDEFDPGSSESDDEDRDPSVSLEVGDTVSSGDSGDPRDDSGSEESDQEPLGDEIDSE